MKTGRIRLAVFGLLAVIMVLASAPSFAFANPPSWFGSANVRRDFTFSGGLWAENTDDPFGSGYSAAIDSYPSAHEPWDTETLLTVENDPDPNSRKDVWLQYTWFEGGPGAIADPMNQNLHGSTGAWSPPTWVTEDLGGGLFRRTIEWSIYPQPAMEWFEWWTDGGFSLTEVSVATICTTVPEPSSMLVLGSGLVGALGCLAKRRRARR